MPRCTRPGWPKVDTEAGPESPDPYSTPSETDLALAPQPLPASERVEPAPAQILGATNGQEEANSSAVSAAVAVLREQLAVANRRIDDLNEERQRDAEERRRLVALLSDLADARAAAEISRNLAAGLQRELELLRSIRPWWRRWLR